MSWAGLARGGRGCRNGSRRFNLVIAVVLVAASCTTQRTVGQPTLSVVNDHIDLTQRTKVDILFMVDNSPSMAPKQAELRSRFPGLIKQLSDLASMGSAASFHIGVVDSDLGAGPYTLNGGQCKPDGDGGKLHTAAVAPDAPAICAGFQLPADAPYIDYDSGNSVSNTGMLSVPDAFTCLASVGETGCGFESQLESVHRALTDTSINPGFLRDDALLVVVWLTDEDDCSAPSDTTLFDPSTYGTLHSFRCTQFGITCDGNPLDGGSLSATSCAPIAAGPLFDVSRYTTLFAAGGVKQRSSDVLLVSIAAPPTPFNVDITQPCEDQANTASCAILQHSCVGNKPAFFGDPAVRLDAVMTSTVNSVEASICDDDYTRALQSLGYAMTARMRAGCLPGAVVDPVDPGCVVSVGDVDTPRCRAVEGALPCWDLMEDMGCPVRLTPAGNMQQLRFTLQGAPLSSASAVCPLYEPAT